jgi:hypothetical protein
MLLSGYNNGQECSLLQYPWKIVVFWLFQSLQVSVCGFWIISTTHDHRAFFRQFMSGSTLLFLKWKGSCVKHI